MRAEGISVILLTKNGGDLFGEVLDALFRCDGIADAEVLVIDSGSTDATLDLVSRHPEARLYRIPPEEFGHGKTRNLGVRLARGQVLVFLVQDATPAPDFLTRLRAPLARPQVAGAYARQLPRPWSNPAERLFLGHVYPDAPGIRSLSAEAPHGIRSFFFSNVASAIRRSVWERIPFDETLIMSEDQQWAKQVVLAGHEIVYEPAAVVLHSHNYPLRDLFRRNFDSGCSLVGISHDPLTRLAAEELAYVVRGVRSLVCAGEVSWIPYFLLYEGTRALGFSLGQRSHQLPAWIRRSLSLHRYHWDRFRPATRAA
jgi:rhamnosyltransferase